MNEQQQQQQLSGDLSAAINEQLERHHLSAWEYSLHGNSGWSLEYLNGKIEKLEQCQTRSLDITVYCGKKRGRCSTNVLEPQAVAEAVKQACSSASYAQEDPAVGIADADKLAWNPPELKLCFESDLTPARAIEIAGRVESDFLHKDARIARSGGLGFDSRKSSYFYANSAGFASGYDSSGYSVSGELLAKDSQGEMQRDGYYDVTCNPARLASADAVMQHALERVLSRLEAQRITPRRCPVIYSAELARTLLGSLLAAASGRYLYLGNSFLLNRLHSKIFPAHIQMTEFPLLPEGLASTPFDAEGVALKEEMPLIKDGVLERYILDSYSARKLNMTTTGNAGGVRNLMVEPTVKGGLDALLKQIDRGLLITELFSGNQNVLNGDYSCGAFGYWVEQGRIRYPVKELTLAGNLLEMFDRLVLVGDDVDRRSSVISGSLVIEEMTVASSQG